MHQWRPAKPVDVPQIAEISSITLAGYPEEAAIFEELIRLSPAGSHVLVMGGRITGYLVSHPWMRGFPPPLNTGLGALPQKPDSWYIHDLSLLESARGFGAAREAVEIAAHCAVGAGLSNLSLVAVNGAAAFWQGRGFTPMMDAEIAGRIASYGDDALYMERAV
jgi:hypothetical protein